MNPTISLCTLTEADVFIVAKFCLLRLELLNICKCIWTRSMITNAQMNLNVNILINGSAFWRTIWRETQGRVIVSFTGRQTTNCPSIRITGDHGWKHLAQTEAQQPTTHSKSSWDHKGAGYITVRGSARLYCRINWHISPINPASLSPHNPLSF